MRTSRAVASGGRTPPVKPRLRRALDQVQASASHFRCCEIATGVLALYREPARVLLLNPKASVSTLAETHRLDAAQQAAKSKVTSCR